MRWNNHHNILVSVLDNLLGKESLVDVTLAAEGRIIRVHRLVLCACSQYFEEMLCTQIDKQAVIFLKDVRFADLKALVDYMYRGEVYVVQDQLSTFLATAEALKIKGLAYKEDTIKGTAASLKGGSQAASKPVRTKKREVPVKVTTPMPTTQQSAVSVENSFNAVDNSVLRSEPHHQSSHQSPVNPTSLQSHLNSVNAADGHFVAVDTKMESDIESDLDPNDDNLEGNENEWSIQDGEDEWSSSNAELVAASESSSSHMIPPNPAFLGQEGWSDSSLAGPSVGNITGNGTPPIMKTKVITKASVKSMAAFKEPTSGGGEGEGEAVGESGLLDGNQSIGAALNRTICTRCGRDYSCRSALLRHLRYECGVGPQFQCPICSVRFKRNERLTYHLRSVHNVEHPLLRRGATKRSSRPS